MPQLAQRGGQRAWVGDLLDNDTVRGGDGRQPPDPDIDPCQRLPGCWVTAALRSRASVLRRKFVEYIWRVDADAQQSDAVRRPGDKTQLVRCFRAVGKCGEVGSSVRWNAWD